MLEQFTEVWGQWGRSWPLFSERLAATDGLLLLRWALQNLFLSLLIAAVDLGAGACLVRCVENGLGRRLTSVVFTLAALAWGLAFAGFGVFALGLAGKLSPRGVFLLTLLMTALAIAGWLADRRRLTLGLSALVPRTKLAWAVAAILLPAAGLHLADLLQPIQEGDSTMYHMVAAREYARVRALPYQPGVRFNAQPHLSVLLYLRHWLLLGDDMLVKLFNVELSVLLLLAIAAALRLYRAPRDSLALAVVFILASPVFAWMTKTEYADLMLAATCAAAAALMAWAIDRRAAWLGALAGPVAGLAGAVKFQGLVICGFLTLVLAAFLMTRVAWRAWFALLAAIGGSTVVFGAAWWWRSWQATRTPVYPFLSNSVDLRRLMEVNASYGFGFSPLDFLLLPLRAVGHHAHRFADPYILGPVLLVWIAAMVARPGLRVQSRAFLFAGIMLFAWFWFRTGQVMRYAACVLPIQGMLFADSLGRFGRRATGVGALVLAPLAAATWMLPSRTLYTAFPPPVTYAAKETALAESLSHYRAVRFLNQSIPAEARVYVWFCEDSRFYLLRPNDGDWFGPHSYFWLSTGAREPRELVRRLRAAGYTHLLLDRQRAAERLEMFDLDFARTAFMQVWGGPEGTGRLYDDGRYVVYRLKE